MNVTTKGTQKESKTLVQVPHKIPQILVGDIPYDTTKPELTIRTFVGDIKSMLLRFEENNARLQKIEDELQDLLHYAELSSYKKVPDGYKIYRKISDLRKERRACKNENDLLGPIYEYFHATEVLNRLNYVQSECAKVHKAIDARGYSLRTDILDEMFDEPAKPEEPEEEEEPIEEYDLSVPEMPIEEKEPVKAKPAANPNAKQASPKGGKYHRVWAAAN